MANIEWTTYKLEMGISHAIVDGFLRSTCLPMLEGAFELKEAVVRAYQHPDTMNHITATQYKANTPTKRL